MSGIGAIVILIVAAVGGYLYLGLVEQNRRTRPERVRQRLRDLGLTDEQIDRAQNPTPIDDPTA